MDADIIKKIEKLKPEDGELILVEIDEEKAGFDRAKINDVMAALTRAVRHFKKDGYIVFHRGEVVEIKKLKVEDGKVV